MEIYRLDKRFVFQAIGINLLMAGLALALTMFTQVAWLQLVGLLVSAALLVRGGLLWSRPPVVARTDVEGVTLGGQLTVKPVSISWPEVEGVSSDPQRLFLERGGERVLAFPLAFVGARGPELLRDVYDRLNASNGYQRFDPS